jgi:hypothetical protein
MNGGLQLGQAFANAQIGRHDRRVTVIAVHNGAADFCFGQLRLRDIVLGGRRTLSEPAGVDDGRFGSPPI